MPAPHLYAGTHGYVLALDKKSGRTIWKTSLPRTGYGVVSILPDGDVVFCAVGGRAFALEPSSGDILWQNDLPGLGHGGVYLATAEGAATVRLIHEEEENARRNHSAGRT